MNRTSFKSRRGVVAIVFSASLILLSITRPAIAQSPQPESVLDHFLCYSIAETTFPPRSLDVSDQFHYRPPWPTRVVARALLCNPVIKYRPGLPTTPVRRPASHLVCYQTTSSTEKGTYAVSNQFTGSRMWRVTPANAALLCLPSGKLPVESGLPTIPRDLDHFKCYALVPPPPVAAAPVLSIAVRDQFGGARASVSQSPQFLCNPALKVIGGVTEGGNLLHAFAHLVCYSIALQGAEFKGRKVVIRNQFEPKGAVVTAQRARLLCVPSTKIAAGR